MKSKIKKNCELCGKAIFDSKDNGYKLSPESIDSFSYLVLGNYKYFICKDCYYEFYKLIQKRIK